MSHLFLYQNREHCLCIPCFCAVKSQNQSESSIIDAVASWSWWWWWVSLGQREAMCSIEQGIRYCRRVLSSFFECGGMLEFEGWERSVWVCAKGHVLEDVEMVYGGFDSHHKEKNVICLKQQWQWGYLEEDWTCICTPKKNVNDILCTFLTKSMIKQICCKGSNNSIGTRQERGTILSWHWHNFFAFKGAV